MAMATKHKLPVIDIEKYGGKQVALVEGRVVASGASLDDVIKRARKKFPSKPLRQISILAVPRSLNVIYYG